MKTLGRSFVAEEKGESLIEYFLVAAFVAAVVTAVLIADPTAIRAALINAFLKAKNALRPT